MPINKKLLVICLFVLNLEHENEFVRTDKNKKPDGHLLPNRTFMTRSLSALSTDNE